MPNALSLTDAGDTDFYLKNLQDRVDALHPDFVNNHPLAAAGMATSSIPATLMSAVSTSYPATAQYVFDKDTFAGEVGKLTQVRLRALGITDPVIRANALQTLNAFNSASPEDQHLIKAYMDHPELFTGYRDATGAVAVPNQKASETGQGAAEALQGLGLQGAKYDPETGDITISSLSNDEDHVVALETLLPSLKGRIHFDDGGISLNDIKDSYANLDYWHPFITNADSGDITKEGLSTNPLDYLTAGGQLGLTGGGYPVLGAGYGLYKGVLDPLTKLLPNDIEPYVRRQDAAIADSVNSQMVRAQRDIGYLPARLSGAKPGTQEFDERSEVYGGILIAVGLHETSEFAGARAVAGGELPESAAARLGLATDEETGRALIGKSVAKSVAEGGKTTVGRVAQTVGRPFSTLLDPVAKAIAYNVSRTTPEEFFSSGLASKIVDQTLKFAAEDPESAASRARVYFGGTVDPAVIQNILDAGEHDAAISRITDMYNNAGRNTVRVGELSTKMKDLESRISAFTDRQTNGRFRMGDVGETGLPAPEPGDIFHITTRAEADAILNGELEPRDVFSKTNIEGVGNEPDQRPASYWADTPDRAAELRGRPLEGATVFRISKEQVIPSARQAGEFKSYVPVPREKLLVWGDDAQWHPVSEIIPEDPMRGLDLNAEKMVLQGQIDEARSQTLETYKYPEKTDLRSFAHRAMYEPQTPFEHMFRRIINPGRTIKTWSNRVFNTNLNVDETSVLGKFFDKLPNRPSLINTTRTEEPGALVKNAQTIEYMGRRFGFTDDEIVRVVDRFEKARSPQEFYEALVHFGDTIDAHLPASTPLSIRRGITRFYDRSGTDYLMRYPKGNGAFEPLVPGPSGENMPSLYNEFLGDRVNLPSMELIDQAVSASKRIARNAFNDRLSPKQIRVRAQNYAEAAGVDFETAVERIIKTQGRGPAVRAAVVAYRTGNIMMSLARLTLKPFDLTFRIPAIIMKKTLDEALGNAATPNIRGNVRPVFDEVSEVIGPKVANESIVPNMLEDALDHVNDRRIVEDVPTRSLVADGSIDKQATWTGQVRRLQFLNSDPIARRFVQLDMDPEAMKLELTGGDPHLTDLFEQNTAHTLERANMSIDTWLERLRTTIDHTTFHSNPDMLNFVRSGSIPVDGNLTSEQAWHYTRMTQENIGIEDRLTELPDNSPLVRALQTKMRENLDQLAALEEEAGGEVNIQKIGKGQERALANYFQRQWQEGNMQLPDAMPIDRWTATDIGGTGSLAERAQEAATQFSGFFYKRLKTIGKWEAKLARGNFFEQRAYQEFQALRAGGMSVGQAKAFAVQRALDQAQDLFYDLSARSTAERGIRNVMWYAPVQGELMYRWLYAIPAEQGNALAGLGLNTLKALNYFQLFQHLHIIHQDPVSKAWVAPIPGLAGLVNALNPHLPESLRVKLPDQLDVPIGSLSHLSLEAPALSGPVGIGLDVAAQKFGGPFRALSNVLQPYGGLTDFWPSAIKYGAEAFGVRLPDFYPAVDRQQYDRVHDQARQFAYTDLAQHGHPQPMIEDYKNSDGTYDRAAYLEAWKKWNDLLEEETNQYAKGMFLVHAAQSSIIPGTITATSEEKQAYQSFLVNKIIPQYQVEDLTPEEKAKISAQFDKWLRDHPDSLAFSITYNYYTGKKWTPPTVEAGDTYWRDQYLNTIKDVYKPEDYAEILPALVSKAHYDAQINGALQRIAPDSLGNEQVPTLLRNWGERRSALALAKREWSAYLNAHPQAGPLIDLAAARMAKARGYPQEGETLQNIQDMLDAAASLSPMFTGESGVPDQEYQTVVGKLRAAEAKAYANGNRSAPATKTEKDIAWYMSKVGEYTDATRPLFNEAAQLADAGQDASAIYDQIRTIKTQYDNLTHNGAKYPSIDEFFFGAKTPQEQKYALANWATKPISWLTPWQRQKLGYADFPGQDDMWQQIRDVKDSYSGLLASVPPTSSQATAIKSLISAQEQSIASTYGQAGVEALALEEAPPYERLTKTGFPGTTNQTWINLTNQVSAINASLTAEGDSIRGYSQAAVADKLFIYAQIESGEANDPQFKKLMTTLSYSIPSAASPGAQRTGVPLYEALFFGQFTYQFIPKSLLAQYDPNAGGV